jgi:hypothetical protein
LVAHHQGKGPCVVGRARQADVEHAVVHLDVAEVFVVLLFAGGHPRRAQGDVGGFGVELQTLAVQVIAFGGDEAQLDFVWRAVDHTQLEGLAHRQEVAAIVQRATQGRARAAVEQAGGGGGPGQHQQQEKEQAMHTDLARK